MKSHDVNLTTEAHKAVIETLQILLEAGSKGDGLELVCQATYFLVKHVTDNAKWRCCPIWTSACASAVTRQFELIFDLVEPLLRHMIQNHEECHNFSFHIVFSAEVQLKLYARLKHISGNDSNYCLGRLKTVMDGLGNLFRCFLVHGGGTFTTWGPPMDNNYNYFL